MAPSFSSILISFFFWLLFHPGTQSNAPFSLILFLLLPFLLHSFWTPAPLFRHLGPKTRPSSGWDIMYVHLNVSPRWWYNTVLNAFEEKLFVSKEIRSMNDKISKNTLLKLLVSMSLFCSILLFFSFLISVYLLYKRRVLMVSSLIYYYTVRYLYISDPNKTQDNGVDYIVGCLL